MALGLPGCDVPNQLNPSWIYKELSGENDAVRPRPPGRDAPYGNLGMVPPRPDRPPAADREALTAALAADRETSRQPLSNPRGRAPVAAASPGSPAIPAAPPRPANLGSVPPVPWTGPAASGRGAEPQPSQPMPVDPGQLAPSAPPPDLLAPRAPEPGLPPPLPAIR